MGEGVLSIKKIIGIVAGAVIGFIIGYIGKCSAPGGIG
jgi:hypothetical protein